MSRSLRLLVFQMLAALAVPAPVAAWNGVGHMIVAKVAYGRLSADDQAALTEALEKHPHYAQYLAAERPDDVGIGEWAAMRAAVWPDWIRPPRRFEGEIR